jgi:hypothetical protein
MKKVGKFLSVAFAVIVIAVLGVTLFAPAGTVAAAAETRHGGPGSWGGNMGNGGGYGTLAGTALDPLSEDEAQALKSAILEEYGAYNLYAAINTQFNNPIPFAYIARSEQQHINALVRQAEKYGVAVPENPGQTDSLSFASLTEACQAGVQAETSDAALYDDLKLVTTHNDLLQVYERLQSASLNSHLPAFQLCD